MPPCHAGLYPVSKHFLVAITRWVARALLVEVNTRTHADTDRYA